MVRFYLCLVSFLTLLRLEAVPFAYTKGSFIALPCFSSKVEVEGSVLYVKPGGSNLDSGLISSYPLILETIEGDYSFGFELGLGYILPYTSNDVKMVWKKFSTKDEAHFNTDGSNSISPLFSLGEDLEESTGKVHFNFSLIDACVGQTVDFGQNFKARLYGGGCFVKIGQERLFSFGETDEDSLLSIENSSSYLGIGPKVGVEAYLNIGSNFWLLADVNGSLLIGKVTRDFSLNMAPTSSTLQKVEGKKKDQYSAGFETKVGLNFNAESDQGISFNLEGGYMIALYVDAIQSLDTVGSNNLTPSSHNFNYGGFYGKMTCYF